MGGTCIPGYSLVVNKVFDLFHSSGHELEPVELMYWEWLVYGRPWRGTDSTYFWLKMLIRMQKMSQVGSKTNI